MNGNNLTKGLEGGFIKMKIYLYGRDLNSQTSEYYCTTCMQDTHCTGEYLVAEFSDLETMMEFYDLTSEDDFYGFYEEVGDFSMTGMMKIRDKEINLENQKNA